MRKINAVFKTTSFKRMSSDTQSQLKIQRAKGFERIFFVSPDCILVEVPQVLWVPSRALVLPLPWSTSYSHLPLGRNISLWKCTLSFISMAGQKVAIGYSHKIQLVSLKILFYSTVQIHQSLHLIHLFGLIMEQISVLHFTSFLYEPHFHSVSTSQPVNHICVISWPL